MIDPDWGKPKIEETSGRKIRRNLLTNEELACDQDDLGNLVTIWDHVYLIHLSKHSNKPEYIYVIEDAILAALMALSLISRQILYYSFCVPDSFSNYRISREVGYSERSIQRMKSEALIEFAEAYKHGEKIAYK